MTQQNFVNIRDLIFCKAFNKTLRVSKASKTSKAGQVSQPVQAKPSQQQSSKPHPSTRCNP